MTEIAQNMEGGFSHLVLAITQELLMVLFFSDLQYKACVT